MGERAGYNISYDIDNKIATKLSLAIFPAVVSFPMLDVRTWPSPHLTVLTDISASPLSSHPHQLPPPVAALRPHQTKKK